MTRKKEDKNPNAGVTNELKLVYPQDAAGITGTMRREVARAIGRVKGDPAKQEVLEGTIQVLVDYSKAVFNKEAAVREKNLVAQKAEQERKAKAAAEEAKRRGAKKRSEAAQLIKDAEALEATATGKAE